MSWSICQRNRTRREQGEVSERRVQIKNGHQAFVSVYYNNADKEIQFHWYRLKVQYTKRFMANLKMIPQYPKKPPTAEQAQTWLDFFGSFFLLFFVGCRWKRFMFMAKIQHKIIKYLHTPHIHTFIVPLQIQRYKIHMRTSCGEQTIFDKCPSLHFSLWRSIYHWHCDKFSSLAGTQSSAHSLRNH